MIKISRESALDMLLKIRIEIENSVDVASMIFATNKCIELKTEFEVYYQGVSNGFISEIINGITGFEVEVIGENEDLYNCPCCGYKTLTELYDLNYGTGYDICPYCKWEDDGTKEIDKYIGLNKGSIQVS